MALPPLRSAAIPCKVFAFSELTSTDAECFQNGHFNGVRNPVGVASGGTISFRSAILYLQFIAWFIYFEYCRFVCTELAHTHMLFPYGQEEGAIFKLNRLSLSLMSYIALNVGVYQKTLKFSTSPPLIICFSQHKPIKCGFPTQYIHPGTDT